MSNAIVVAALTAHPGSEAALQEVLLGLLAPTHKETGCLSYELHRDPADPATFVFIETWADQAALKLHLATPHYLAARARQETLVAQRNVRILERL